MKFGAHVSIAGGIEKASYRAYKIGCECFQIFTRSPQGGNSSPLRKNTVEAFLKECSVYGITDYYIHTPYFINLASKDRQIRLSSISLIEEEIERGSTIGAKYVITHIGSAKGVGKSQGIKNVVNGIKRVLDTISKSTDLLIEASAGQGEIIGDRFEEIAEILERVGNPDLGVCLDTAHIFASGYDIRTEEAIKKTLDEFSSVVGLEKLKLLHGNDSKVGLGERKDRHEHIGRGKIGIEGFRAIVNAPRLKDIDLIIETPLDKVEGDIRNLKRLKGLRCPSPRSNGRVS
ncbi:MAG: endonuclease [Candidatus Dadabacteria bacterium]